MSSTTIGTPASTRAAPPMMVSGPVAWLRTNLFSTWLSTAVTLLLAYLLFGGVLLKYLLK